MSDSIVLQNSKTLPSNCVTADPVGTISAPSSVTDPIEF